jgi:quinoprotein glucose dehydrogenase
MDQEQQTGTTRVDWSRAMGGGRGGGSGRENIDGLSIWKGPVGRITAIDMNTGDHIWMIPHGDARQAQQDLIREHPLLQGIAGVPINPGRTGHSAMVATPNLLFASGQTADDEWKLFAIDKKTGERLGAVPLPGSTRYGMSSWVHEGKQYVIIQLNNGYAAMALP